jgi:hypothetical protein
MSWWMSCLLGGCATAEATATTEAWLEGAWGTCLVLATTAEAALTGARPVIERRDSIAGGGVRTCWETSAWLMQNVSGHDPLLTLSIIT